MFKFCILVTFRDTNSARFYTVLRCLEKWVLVTKIRNLAKFRIYASYLSMHHDEFWAYTRSFYYGFLKGKCVYGVQITFGISADRRQPQAIEALVQGFQEGNQCQTLLGVTGSGKTFTMANVIQVLNKPTLILAHY